jgi:hypothetical protein
VKARLLVLFVLVACGTGSGKSVATISSTTTTTSEAESPTTAAPTTPADVTTTIAGDGLVPLVVSRFGVMGYWDGSSWVDVEGPGDVPVESGAQFQVVMLDQPITNAVGGAVSLCEPAGSALMAFDPPLPGEFQAPGALAILASWPVRPYEVTVDPTAVAEHRQAVIDFLGGNNIDDADPPITQHITTDLEGDGAFEVVLVAKRVPDDLFGSADDYSLALLRKQIEGEWQTAVLEFHTGSADNAYILSHSIAALADLNGDGKMEIVIDAAYYEGAGTVAYEYVNDDLGAVVALGGGCGA